MVALFAVTACAGGSDRVRNGAAADADTSGQSASFTASSWRFDAPSVWDNRVLIREDSSGGLARSSSVFEYHPFDTSLPVEPVLRVIVYDSAAWAGLEQRGDAASGLLMDRGPGVAYVVEIPGANPYPPESRDAAEYTKRLVTRGDVAAAFRVLR